MSIKGWKDVPVPGRLAHRPRDHRGFIVPWVSCWSSGDLAVEERVFAVGDGFLQTPIGACDHIDGQGEPDLGKLCTERQTTGMLQRLCDACGGFIEPGPIYFIGDNTSTRNGQAMAVFRELGLHRECALYSLRVCPGLNRTGPGIVPPSVFECTAYQVLPAYMHKVSDDDVDTFVYDSFAQAYNVMPQPAVLMGVHGVPINPTITLATAWVAAQLTGSTA